MEKIKNMLLTIYYDLMSHPLLSIIIRIVFVCFILILIAYFLFYAILNSPYIKMINHLEFQLFLSGHFSCPYAIFL